MWSQSTNVTGQTDDLQSQDRALHNRASCGKKMFSVMRATLWYADRQPDCYIFMPFDIQEKS